MIALAGTLFIVPRRVCFLPDINLVAFLSGPGGFANIRVVKVVYFVNYSIGV